MVLCALAIFVIPRLVFASAGDAPGLLDATPGASSPVIATLTWVAPNPAPAHYNIYTALSPEGPYRLAGSTTDTQYDYTGGLGGMEYYFRVTGIAGDQSESAYAQCGPVAAPWADSPHVAPSLVVQTCAKCHAEHGGSTVLLGREELATDSRDATALCRGCHNGRVKQAANVSTGTVDSFSLGSGHSVGASATAGALVQDCASCHEQHGVASQRPMLTRDEVNGVAVAGPGPGWCESCHDSKNSWFEGTYPSISDPSRDASGYPVAGTWPGPSTYADPANAHSLIPETTQTAETGRAISRKAGDCLYCHAAHRGPNAYDGLLATYRPTSASTIASDQADGTYAQVCFTCHGSTPPSGIATASVVDIKQFATARNDFAGHRIVTEGGNLPVGAQLPCYDCHNPHGSTRGNGSMISDERGTNLRTDTATNVRRFCFTCHTTNDNTTGWDSEHGAYVPIAASDEIEGLPRTGGILHLPSIPGHREADLTSCYTCHGQAYSAGGRNVHDPDLGGGYDAAKHTGTPAAADITIGGTTFPARQCADCHSTTLGTEHFKESSNGHEKGCGLCHPTPQSSLTPSWDKTGCAQNDCHTASSDAPMHANVTADHATLPVNSGCTTCHAGTLADVHVGASTVVDGQARTSCQVCHSDGVPSTQDCRVCHGITPPHDTTASFCLNCHADTRGTYPGGSVAMSSPHMTTTTSLVASVEFPGSGDGPGTCANCHAGHSGTNAAGNELCYSCHDAAGTSRPASYSYLGSAAFSTSAHDAAGCTACHPVHGASATSTVGPYLVPKNDSPCLSCHADAANSANGVSVTGAFTSSGDPSAAHDLKTLVGPSAKLTCESCHQPHAASTTSLANPYAPKSIYSAQAGDLWLDNPDAAGATFSLTGSVPADSVHTEGRDGDPLEIDLPVVADTTLDENDQSYNYGLATTVVVNDTHNGLLRVDDSLLPPDSYITGAELHVYSDDPASNHDRVDVHLASEPDTWSYWKEGGGGNSGSPNSAFIDGATWKDRWYSNPPSDQWGAKTWAYPGGSDDTHWTDPDNNQFWDQSGNAPYGPYGTSDFAADPGSNWASFDVTKAMQTIHTVTDAPVDSLLLRPSTSDANLVFASKDDPDESHRPYVRVKYYRTTMTIDAGKLGVYNDGDVSDGGNEITVSGSDQAIMDFNLGDIPDKATITSVKLLVYSDVGQDMNQDSFKVFGVKDDWDVGASGQVGLSDAVASYIPDDYKRGDGQWIQFSGKDILRALQDPDNRGLMIAAQGSQQLTFHTGDGNVTYAPKLEVQYSMDEPSTDAADSIDYCLTCHGDDPPGSIGGKLSLDHTTDGNGSLAFQKTFHNSHGDQFGPGPGARPTFNGDASLKGSYFYGMGPLQCTDCHDPHGSSNAYHLKTDINGSSGLAIGDTSGSNYADVEQWCGACHDLPQNHEWWADGDGCLNCHYHGRTNTQRF